jgi:hypothetical protein
MMRQHFFVHSPANGGCPFATEIMPPSISRAGAWARLVMGYTALEPPDIRERVELLAQALKKVTT